MTYVYIKIYTKTDTLPSKSALLGKMRELKTTFLDYLVDMKHGDCNKMEFLHLLVPSLLLVAPMV